MFFVHQEVLLVSFERGINHLDCGGSCKWCVHRGWAWITRQDEWIRFEEGVHCRGHGEARPAMDEALGAFELLQGFHDMLEKCAELGKVQAGCHCGVITKESCYFVEGDNAIHFNGYCLSARGQGVD
jgi:hypothetical protein